MDAATAVRAEVLLLTSSTEIALGDIRPTVRCDLSLVDALARMQLAARRMGWSIRLADVDDELTGFLDLVGLSDVLA